MEPWPPALSATWGSTDHALIWANGLPALRSSLPNESSWWELPASGCLSVRLEGRRGSVRAVVADMWHLSQAQLLPLREDQAAQRIRGRLSRVRGAQDLVAKSGQDSLLEPHSTEK